MKMSSFERGFCRVFDLGGKNKSILNITKRVNDYDAMMKDWENVGKYITAAERRYEPKNCER